MSEDYVQQCCDKAASFISRGDYDAAEKYLKKALERQPDNLKVLSLLSLVSEGRKKSQKQLEAKLAFVENNSIFIETITRSLISEISIS